MRFFVRLLVTAVLLTVPAFAHAQAVDSAPDNADLPVTHVSLYTSGVGYFERKGAVEGDASQTLVFPIDQINDILKSLVLIDTGGGAISPVTYAAQDPVDRQLQAFPVDLSDNPDRATLLNRLRGASVTVSEPDQGTTATTVTGQIVGVESRNILLPDNGGTVTQSFLNLAGDSGLVSLPLDKIFAIKFLDPKLNAEINEALTVVAAGRDAKKRSVTLHFTGHGKRDVLIGYVTETPLWQTSYRLVLSDQPLIQGWALVQNTSQDDWNGIHLDLVSGQLISFTQDLYTPIYVPRPSLQAQIAASIAPQTYASNMNGVQFEELTGGPSDSPRTKQVTADAPAAIGGVSSFATDMPSTDSLGNDAFNRSVATRGAKLGQSFFTYNISEPVTVPRQQSAMIPFLSTQIQARRVSIYNVNVLSAHPLSGARMLNTSNMHLMGGPITVFDQQQGGGTNYVGDAVIDDTEPGQTRLFSFAVDLAVDGDQKSNNDADVHTYSIDQGVLYDNDVTRVTTTYSFKNNSTESRLIVVEHAIQGDNYKLIEPKADETTPDRYRFDLPLESKQSKKLVVREEETNQNTVGLIDCDLGSLYSYSQTGDLDPAMKQTLSEIVARRRTIADVEAQIAETERKIDAIGHGQDRIRENMKALDHTSDLYQRYAKELDSQETTLNSLSDQQNTLQSQLNDLKNQLSAYISKLTVQ